MTYTEPPATWRPPDVEAIADSLGVPRPSHGIRFHWAIDDDPEHVVWLIDGFMPARCLILVVGREGSGKSTLAARLISLATRGRLSGEPVKCLVLGTEDGWRSRWIPRLHASEADLAKVSRDPEIVTIEEDGEEVIDLVSLADPGNLVRLAAAMKEEGIGLLYLDHLGDALPAGTDQNAYGPITTALKRINRWAMANEVTVIAGWHFGKGGGRTHDKIIGSVGFRTSARCVALVAEDEEGGHRVLAIDKCNDLDVGATPARTFTIEETEVSIKGSTFTTTTAGPLESHPGRCGREVVQQLIDEASSSADGDDQRETKDQVADFIRSMLQDAGGSMDSAKANEVVKSKFNGVGGSTLTKAKRAAGVVSRKSDFTGGWLWILLTGQDSTQDSQHSYTRVKESTESSTESSRRVCADCDAPIGSGFVRCLPCIRLMKGGAS